MGFKEVQSLDAEVTTALGGKNKKTGKSNPTKAEGYYLGSRKVESKKSKSGFAYIHFLQTPNGNLGIWGKTDLDRKLTAVTPGTMVRVTQSGMTSTPNGDMYKFKVELDSDNTIEVTAQASDDTSSSESEETSEDDDTYTDYNASAEDEEATQEVAQAAALSAAQRKAKVEALLKGKR